MKNLLISIGCFVLTAFCACQNNKQQHNIHSSFEQLSEQGRSLCRSGKYMEGMILLQQANDSLAMMNPDSINPEGEVKFLGNLANMYIRMGLLDEGRQTNSEAMKIADAKVPARLPDLYRMRSVIYSNTNQRDSELYCLRKALELSERIKDDDFRIKNQRRGLREIQHFFIQYPDYAPDSIPEALAILENENYDDPTNQLLIGRGNFLIGNTAKGISYMEKAVNTYRQTGDIESLEWGLQVLAQTYASTNDRKLFDIYEESAALHDSIKQTLRDDLLLGMDFKYRTSHLKKEKAILESQLQVKRQRIVFISIIAIIIVAAFLTFILMRVHNNKRQLSLKQQNIDTLLAERISLNSRIEELNNLLTANKTELTKNDSLPAILLEKEDEKLFCKNFNDLHPGFIDRLRHKYPDLTTGNELLCMLIALHRRNDEIALALGISRESVATSRYRLRSRFNLKRDVDLNAFIQSML